MTQTCVSISTGTSGPDQRVNYAHGMVLGVDDFTTEQNYWLYHRYLALRGLSGMGTVYGLQVTAQTPADDADDVQVTVSTGMLVDQFGRDAVIRCPQCARLGAWLAAKEQTTPGTVASQRGPAGEITVYVVARYDQCLDALVPLPGSPCSSSDQIATPSRITDSWEVDLTFDPPAMPRWDADRRLARLLSLVDSVPGLPETDSDEALLLAAVRALLDQADDGPSALWPPGTPPLPSFRIPAESAADILDRVFVVWVTEVRPLLLPDLTTPYLAPPSGLEPAPEVLLASITFVPADPFDTTAPVIVSFDAPDDSGRPYLLHTGLIQLLRTLDTDELPQLLPQDIAQLSALANSDGQLLEIKLWFTFGEPVSLPKTIEVSLPDGRKRSYRTDPVGGDTFSDRWSLLPTGGTTHLKVTDDEMVRVAFPGDRVRIGSEQDNRTLAEAQLDGLLLTNAEPDGTVFAYGNARVAPAPPPEPEPQPPAEQRASVDFVTITGSTKGREVLIIETWFHPQPYGPVDDVLVEKPAVRIFDEQTGQDLQILGMDQHPGGYRNVWTITTKVPENQVPFPAYLRLLFLVDDTVVDARGNGTSLGKWIDETGILFVGWDRDQRLITAFSRHELPRE